MKLTKNILLVACVAGVSLPALADTFTDKDGRQVECHYEQVKGNKDHPIAAPVIGAIAGGVVGNQFGSGKGNNIATGVGAAGGAYAGKKYNDNRTEDNGDTRQVCTPIK